MGVIAACEGACGVPCQRGHEEAVCGIALDEAEVGGEHAGVLDRVDGRHVRLAAVFEHIAELGCRRHGGNVPGVALNFVREVGHYAPVKARGLLGREGIGHIAGKALRPWRVADLVERDVAVAAREVSERGWVVCVSRSVEVHAARLLDVVREELPGQAVCRVAVQVKDGIAHRVLLLSEPLASLLRGRARLDAWDSFTPWAHSLQTAGGLH